MDLSVFLNQHVRSSTQHKCFYHFTDRRNLESIRAPGILCREGCRAQSILVPAPGGNQWSWDADHARGLDRYVHLCFTADHPMKHVCQQGGRITDAVWLRIRLDVLLRPGIMIISDVANKADVSALPAAKALDHLDLEVLYKRTNWKDPAVNARLRIAQKYEILVPDQISLDEILNPNG